MFVAAVDAPATQSVALWGGGLAVYTCDDADQLMSLAGGSLMELKGTHS